MKPGIRIMVAVLALALVSCAGHLSAQTRGGAGSAPTAAENSRRHARGQAEAVALRVKLPYREGERYRVSQGPGGSFSHTGLNRHAYDFAMPEGTAICAAAAGRVVRVKQDSQRGGPDPALLHHGNTIIIDHGEGYFTQYLHLRHQSATVAEGDLVRGGQVIALSGNTGFSSIPHLHFQVQDAAGQSLPCSFLDVPGTGVPQAGRSYASYNDGEGVSRYAGESPMPLMAFEDNGIVLTRTNLPAHLLRGDHTYTVTGTAPASARQVALFLMGPQGGKPVHTVFARVMDDGSFAFEFSLERIRRQVPAWSDDPRQSNMLTMAIAPVRRDGSYWSSFSIPVTAR